MLLVAALALLLCGTASARAQAVDAEDGFTARIAQERSAHGLPGLAFAADLQDVARRHAQRMADRGERFHNPDLASEVGDWSLVAENVGFGPTVDDVHQAFMASSEHREIILHVDLTQVGVGVVRGGDGRLWVVEVFRRPAEAAPPAPPPTAPPATVAPAPAPTAPAPPPTALSTPTPASPPETVPQQQPRPSSPPPGSDELAAPAPVVEVLGTTVRSRTAVAPDLRDLAADTPGAAWVGAFLLAAVVGLQGQTLRRLGLVGENASAR